MLPDRAASTPTGRCLHLASTSVQYVQDSRRRPSVKLPMSSRLDPTVEQQIGALPLPTKRSTRVAESQGESFTIFKFGQSMESVYHIRVLRKEVDLLAAADLRERMSKMTAGDGGNPAGTFAVLDQYETTAIHLGFYKEVQRNVLGKMMGTARVHVDLLESPAPYQYDLDLPPDKEPNWSTHSLRRLADTTARRHMEDSGATVDQIDIYFGWHERVLLKAMQVHYSQLSIRERMLLAKITGYM